MHGSTPFRLSMIAQLIACGALTACGGGSGDESRDAVASDRVVASPARVDPTAVDTNSSVAGEEILTAGQSSAPSMDVGESDIALTAEGTGSLEGDDRQGVLAATATVSCSSVPSIPTPPANAKKVTSYGATPDDDTDDTVAIQAALKDLKPGEWLVFPPGRYIHNKALRTKVEGTKLYGKGATLHATNPSSMAVMLSADNTALYSFKLTAVTTKRMSASEQARIAVFKDDDQGNKLTAYNVTIQGNTVINAGEAGTPTANSSSSVGILIYRVNGFLVAQNTVARTLADGIHMTSGSTNGRVLNNVVRENGDDMIAVVSYAQSGNPALGSTAGLLDVLNSGSGLNTNILISGNKVSNNYWGRGISVIGGSSVTIRGNTVEGVPGAGGILLAREHNYRSHGVTNVLVENNLVQDIQNTTPPYNPGGKYTGTRSGHGTIELHDFMFVDEYSDSIIREKLTLQKVMVRNNKLQDSYPSGIRTGVPGNGTMYATDPLTGQTVGRSYQTGITKSAALIGDQMSNTKGLNLIVPGTQLDTMSCSNISMNGNSVTTATCVAAAPLVTGAAITGCSMSASVNSEAGV